MVAETGAGASRSASRCSAGFAAWAREKLYQLINYRISHNLPTVVTSNWTEREFAQYHSRIASRLKTAVHFHISAPDARGKIARGAAQ